MVSVVLTVIVIVCVVVFLVVVGPRPQAGYRIRPLELPDTGLDTYLKRREKAADGDILPGCAKRIVWARAKNKRTRHAIVYLHGFTATREETSPLTAHIAAKLKANVYYTRMKAHGLKTGDEFSNVCFNDWYNDAYEALEIGKRLGENVILVCVSTGATFGTLIADSFRDRLSACVFISPNYAAADRRAEMLLWPWGKWLARLLIGKYRTVPRPGNARSAKFWTLRYRSEGLLPMMAAVRECRRIDYERFTPPTLILYTEKDTAVSTSVIKQVYERLGSKSKRLVDLKESEDHVLAGDMVSPQATDAAVKTVLDFLKGIKIS